MTLLTKAVATVLVAGWTAAASAAPIGATTGDLRIDIAPAGPALTYIEDGAGGADLLLDPLTFGFDQEGEDYYVDLLLSFAAADPAGEIVGSLSVYDDAAGTQLLFGGDLTETGTLPGDIAQFLFGSQSAPATGFTSDVLVELAFLQDLPGDDPLAQLVDGERYEIAGSIESVAGGSVPAPIPLPAPLFLLLGSAALLAGVAGNRRAGGVDALPRAAR